MRLVCILLLAVAAQGVHLSFDDGQEKSGFVHSDAPKWAGRMEVADLPEPLKGKALKVGEAVRPIMARRARSEPCAPTRTREAAGDAVRCA